MLSEIESIYIIEEIERAFLGGKESFAGCILSLLPYLSLSCRIHLGKPSLQSRRPKNEFSENQDLN